MRLSKFEIESIRDLAMQHFGDDVQVFLFGSRTNDQQRGGDIDLFIRSRKDNYIHSRKKINFIADLILQIGEQKIDVVLDHPNKRSSTFYQSIYQNGIRLC